MASAPGSRRGYDAGFGLAVILAVAVVALYALAPRLSGPGPIGAAIAEALAAGAELKLRPEAIRPIPASSWPSKVRRPANSVFDTAPFEAIFNVHLPPWQNGIRQLIKTLQARGDL